MGKEVEIIILDYPIICFSKKLSYFNESLREKNQNYRRMI